MKILPLKIEILFSKSLAATISVQCSSEISGSPLPSMPRFPEQIANHWLYNPPGLFPGSFRWHLGGWPPLNSHDENTSTMFIPILYPTTLKWFPKKALISWGHEALGEHPESPMKSLWFFRIGGWGRSSTDVGTRTKAPLATRKVKKKWWKNHGCLGYLLGQWLNFKLFGITYLIGKIKFKLFFSGSIGWVRVYRGWNTTQLWGDYKKTLL